MAKQQHPIFRNQPTDEAKLWRYLSFAKFASLLQSRCLHFTLVDKFDDHFEGVWPKSDLRLLNSLKGFNIPAFTEQMKRSVVAASCWVESSHESAAMWRLYAPAQEGIAITTTFKKLNAVVVEAAKEAEVVGMAGAGRVQYFDHLNEGLIAQLQTGDPLPNTLVPFMIKNLSYEHEHETRALLLAQPDKFEIRENGCDLPITPSDFIDRIFTSPLSEEWFHAAVLDLAERQGLGGKVERSALSPDRFYMRVTERP